MKTKCLLVVCLILVVCTAQAQELEHKAYLPIVGQSAGLDGTMGLWSYVEPTPTTNLIGNPSLETNLTGWATAWGDATAQAANGKFGVYGIQVVAGGGANAGIWFTDIVGLTPGETVTFSAWVLNPLVLGITDLTLIVWDGGGFANGVTSPAITQVNEWVRYEVQKVVPGGGSIRCGVFSTSNVGTFFADAFQAEVQAAATTYCDGDQPGCEWIGAAHASTSARSALSRAGGTVVDFEDLSFDIGGMFGAGMSPITVNVDSFAVLDGGEVNSIKTDERTFTLSGWVTGTSLPDLHAKRQVIIDALKPNAVPNDQPVLLRYTGAAITKEIAATYEAGLAGTIRGAFPCLEQNFVLRFLATDPNWYEIGNSAAVLDTVDTPTLRYVTARLRATGQWEDLGLAANPTTNGAIYTVLYASDGYVYIGGQFTGLNGVAGRDYVARYNRATGLWENVGGAGDFGNNVYKLIEGPDGNIYAGGAFVNAAGDANADYLAVWTGAAWTAVGPGPAGGGFAGNYVWTMAFNSIGTLIFGGSFINWAGNANSDGLAQWDGAAYNNIGAPGLLLGDSLDAIAIDALNNIYVGGNFLNLGGVATADFLGFWNGIAWNDVGGITPSARVRALAFNSAWVLHIGGDFTDLATIAEADYIAQWNGQAYAALASGVNGPVYAIHFTQTGMMYASGTFTAAGTLTIADRVARWNGKSWAHFDVDLPGTPIVRAIETSPSDPVVRNNFDVWFGFSTTGVAAVAGIVAVPNNGTEDAYPVIEVSRTGGTEAILKTLRNEPLGLELLFDYALLDGETLTIDLSPRAKSIISNFWGPRPDAILKNSDWGTWHLGPETDQVTAFVDVAGAPTVVGTLEWRDPYWAAD